MKPKRASPSPHSQVRIVRPGEYLPMPYFVCRIETPPERCSHVKQAACVLKHLARKIRGWLSTRS